MNNATKLANDIINDAESELGMIPFAVRMEMIETYSNAIKNVHKGGIFLAHIYDETTKKDFNKGYVVA